MTTPSQPTWLTPSQIGMLSNKLGSNTTTDAINFSAQYSNPTSSADVVGMMRTVVTRQPAGGGSAPPVPAWDSSWIGVPTLTNLPVGLHSFGTAISCPSTTGAAFSRVYVVGGVAASGAIQNTVWSAPFYGGSIGTWRAETPIPAYCLGMGCVAIGSYIYVIAGQQTFDAQKATGGLATATAHCWSAPILGDGMVGGWTLKKLDLPGVRVYPSAFQAGAVSDPTLSVWGYPILMVTGGGSVDGSAGAQASTYATTLNPDGTFQGWTTFTNMIVPVFGHFSFFDPLNAVVWALGGADGASAKTTTQYATWNTGTRSMGTWTTSGALPAARAGHSGVYIPAFDVMDQGRVVLIGGTAASFIPSTTPVASIIRGTISTPTAITWTTGAGTLPTAANCLGAAASLESTSGGYSNGVWQVAVVGGDSATGPIATTSSFSSLPGNPANGLTTLYTGVGTALSAFGGPTVTSGSTPGTQNVSWSYNATAYAQAAITAPLSNGDTLTVSVQFIGNLSGDPSPVSYTSVQVGQPPTITSPTPSGAITTGEPIASFGFASANPGAYEQTWRLVVTDPGGNVVFDTSIRPDLVNSATVAPAPLLYTGFAYTFTWTVTTALSPIDSRSSTSATVATTVTPSYTPPPVPA